MGVYSFRAEPLDSNSTTCTLEGIPDSGFSFEAVFSRFRDGGVSFVSINNIAHQGEFDGQIISAMYGAPRELKGCTSCQTSLTESFRTAVLSASQNRVAGGSCPDNALDGGVPALDEDAGVTGPGATSNGFDGVRACGELSDSSTANPPPDTASDTDGGCKLACNTCVLRYRLVGERR